MQNLSEIKALLQKNGLRPKHRLGQNFLHDQNHLTRIIEVAEVTPGELILEIGPGTGTLTETLLESGAEVIAVEIDEDMLNILEDCLLDKYASRLELIEGDCLATKHSLNPEIAEVLDGRSFKLVANLPYQIISPLIGTILASHIGQADQSQSVALQAGGYSSGGCTRMVVMVQREAADRILAKPGTRQYGPLSVLVDLTTTASRIAKLSPQCFWPIPKVESAVIVLDVNAKQNLPAVDLSRFVTFLSRLFGMRRKQLGKILGRDHDWPDGIDPAMRPDQLHSDQILMLFSVFAST